MARDVTERNTGDTHLALSNARVILILANPPLSLADHLPVY